MNITEIKYSLKPGQFRPGVKFAEDSNISMATLGAIGISADAKTYEWKEKALLIPRPFLFPFVFDGVYGRTKRPYTLRCSCKRRHPRKSPRRQAWEARAPG